MPAKKRKVEVNGEERDALIMPFQTGGEHWNEYLVDDGSVIRIKLVVTEVLKVEGEYDPLGNPAYLIQSTNVTAVTSPEELQRGNQ